MDADTTRKLLLLQKQTGYTITQISGQRVFGPPPNWVGPSPPKGTEVFVARIPTNMFEDELIPVFSRIGKIYEFRLMMDYSGNNRGYAFVRYTSPQNADLAVNALNHFEIRAGFPLGVVKSTENTRLYVGGLPKEKSKEVIFEELSKYMEDIKDIVIHRSIVDSEENRGYAFVEFDSHRSAALSRKRYSPFRLQLWGHYVHVEWAIPDKQADLEAKSEVSGILTTYICLCTHELYI
jgi:RNA-binding proteins (RRM domain)